MGIRIERQKNLKFKKVYEGIKFHMSKKAFRMSGKLNEWNEVELVSRIFYKKLEKLLYTPKLLNEIHSRTIKKLLTKNNLQDKTIYDIIKDKDFQIEAVNVFILKIFDFVYYTAKKKLPYTANLSLISNAISELLENTFKYSSGKFYITAGIFEEREKSLVIQIENTYDEIDDKVEKGLRKLRKGIEEVNRYDEPSKAFVEIMKERVLNSNTNSSSSQKESRLGFAKMRVDTNATIQFHRRSKHYGEKGITITLLIPLKLLPKNEMQKIVKDILKG